MLGNWLDSYPETIFNGKVTENLPVLLWRDRSGADRWVGMALFRLKGIAQCRLPWAVCASGDDAGDRTMPEVHLDRNSLRVNRG